MPDKYTCDSCLPAFDLYFLNSLEVSIMEIYVDPDRCIGCEICVDTCPDIFEMQADGLSHVKKDAAACDPGGCCEEAAELCPTDAIFIDGKPR